jgi:hypothetical protein
MNTLKQNKRFSIFQGAMYAALISYLVVLCVIASHYVG